MVFIISKERQRNDSSFKSKKKNTCNKLKIFHTEFLKNTRMLGESVASVRKTKQGFHAITKHDNFKQKASAWFVSTKVIEATFCVGVRTKRPT